MLRSHVSGCISMRAVLYEVICATGVLHHPRAKRRSPQGDPPREGKATRRTKPLLDRRGFCFVGVLSLCSPALDERLFRSTLNLCS